MARLPSSRISPTAHYTGYVWLRHGLSHPAFATNTGRLFFTAARPINLLSSLVGGTSLESMLMARHRVIDRQFEDAIESGEVGSVLEVAAGLSPRGYRFTRRFPDLHYVEADLPAMAAHKREILGAAGELSEHHRVVEIDALADDGESSIAAVCARELPTDRGLAVITEGLLSYFDTDVVRGIFGRFSDALSNYPAGLYLSDLHVDDDIAKVRGARAFRRVLNQWTRGDHHTYFANADDAVSAVIDAGFSEADAPFASDFADELDLRGLDQTGRVRVLIARS